MTNQAYWKTRALLLEALLDERSTATVEAIARLYDLAQADILAQIERIFARYVKGGALSEEQALRLLSVRETEEMRRELLELLEQAEGQAKRDIWARLSAPAYANRISRLQALQDRLYAQCRALGAQEISLVRDRLRDTLEQSCYRTVFDIQQGAGLGWSVERLGSRQITAALAADWNGKHWSKRIWDNNEAFARSVQDTVTTGVMTGQTYREMRDNLLHAIGADPGEGAKYNAARLVKTETAYIANQGHLMGYRSAGIETYIFLATLDLRTSQVCRKLDMKRFPVAEAQAGTNLPPMHPHCRSTTMPDMKPETPKKLTRFARDPVTGEAMQVSGDMTYSQWYHRYVAGNPEALAAESAVHRRKPAKGVASSTDSGIIKAGSDAAMIRNIESPIEKRDSGKGNPNAILQIGYPLNQRQKRLLEALPDYDSRTIVPKSDVSMKDLAALTAQTGCEYALFTRRGKRMVIRGDADSVNINKEAADKLFRDGYRWSGHTHPGVDDLVLMASDGDKLILSQFRQEFSVIYNSKGRFNVFGKE